MLMLSDFFNHIKIKNMKVIFHTNLDAYQIDCFPKNLECVPRIGEKINVVQSYVDYFRNKHLPIRLEVVSVTYDETPSSSCELGDFYSYTDPKTVVTCELHYNKTDKELADINGAKT